MTYNEKRAWAERWERLMRWVTGDRLAQFDEEELKDLLSDTDDLLWALNESLEKLQERSRPRP